MKIIVPPAIRLEGDKDKARSLVLAHAERLWMEFRRLTGFRSLQQNDRRVDFDDGSKILMQTRFGQEVMTVYAPPQTKREEENKIMELIPFFYAYRGAEMVPVLCRGGLNFGPPYEVVDFTFRREGLARVFERPFGENQVERFTILPVVSLEGTYQADVWNRQVSAEVLSLDPWENNGDSGTVKVTKMTFENVAYTYPTPESPVPDTLALAVHEFDTRQYGYTITEWFNSLGVRMASQVSDRFGEVIYMLRNRGVVDDTSPNKYGAVFSVADYTAFTPPNARIVCAHNDTKVEVGEFFLPLSFGATVQQEGWFSWLCATNKSPERGYRMGILQNGRLLADTVLPVDGTTRELTAQDGTVLKFAQYDKFATDLQWIAAKDEAGAQIGVEQNFGLLRREVIG